LAIRQIHYDNVKRLKRRVGRRVDIGDVSLLGALRPARPIVPTWWRQRTERASDQASEYHGDNTGPPRDLYRQ